MDLQKDVCDANFTKFSRRVRSTNDVSTIFQWNNHGFQAILWSRLETFMNESNYENDTPFTTLFNGSGRDRLEEKKLGCSCPESNFEVLSRHLSEVRLRRNPGKPLSEDRRLAGIVSRSFRLRRQCSINGAMAARCFLSVFKKLNIIAL